MYFFYKKKRFDCRTILGSFAKIIKKSFVTKGKLTNLMYNFQIA